MLKIANQLEEPGSPTYPREDKCGICGEHIGFILNEHGEMFALGDCGSKDAKHKKARRAQDE